MLLPRFLFLTSSLDLGIRIEWVRSRDFPASISCKRYCAQLILCLSCTSSQFIRAKAKVAFRQEAATSR